MWRCEVISNGFLRNEVMMVKKALIWLVLAVVMLHASGCSTPVLSSGDRWRNYKAITRINWRMLNEDWDYLWLMDRSSMLTQWHPHIGL